MCLFSYDGPPVQGRGGSPLQKLIWRELCLSGCAEEIYIRSSRLVSILIREIIESEPTPVPQIGEAVIFKRRRSEQSEIPELTDLDALYDFIRILDGAEYPRAFLERGKFRYEFTRADLYDGRIQADVTITLRQWGGDESAGDRRSSG